jgi:dipeptidyl aminopeptidase/acylaminoacyl peptidase
MRNTLLLWGGMLLTTTAAAAGTCGQREPHYLGWSTLEGDFILQARVRFIGSDARSHQGAGWIVKRNLDAGAPYIEAAVERDGADVIQLERRGNTYTVSRARQGDPFTTRELPAVDLGPEPLASPFSCSDDARTILVNVRVIHPAKPDFVPYQDYIGSRLEVLTVATGDREVLHSSRIPFEAPNWTRDGAALIFNTSGTDPATRGRLYRFDLKSRTPALIDTGFATRNNNDHVLSFDGTMLGISDQSTEKGESTIFTLPLSGGVPKRVTALTPSYLHSWSPDGKFLVYTGGRAGNFDIYKIAADGSGQEIRLTTDAALDDGPEFSRDGKYIYFNSARSGRMQLWRMKPDGKDQQQLTNDEFNNWFPHLSPDGKTLVMISYADPIAANEHPYYKHVYLRLMPADGGAAKVIAYVYGGQGTINVPSWSPDGRQLAFVSNSEIDAGAR